MSAAKAPPARPPLGTGAGGSAGPGAGAVSGTAAVRLTAPPAPGKSTSMERRKQTPEDYLFGRLIGEGSFSSVFLAREVSTRREFAIKVCDKSHIIREKKQEYVQSEKRILVKIAAEWDERVPFFVKIYSTFQVKLWDCVCVCVCQRETSFFKK